MMNDLKPCPSCGSAGFLRERFQGKEKIKMVYCDEYHMPAAAYYYDEYHKCNFCKNISQDIKDIGLSCCYDVECRRRDRFTADKDEIIRKAKEKNVSVSDLISLIKLR